MNGGPKVFISYKRGHGPTMKLVAELEAALAGHALQALRDVDIEPGNRWPDELWRWLMECSAAVVVVSDDAARSDWCRREWSVLAARAAHTGLRVIPVHVGKPGPNANILDHLQAVAAEGDDPTAAVAAIVEQLDGLRSTPPTADDHLAAHRAWLQWQFAHAPALGKEPFSLADAYIDTECGVLTWQQICGDRNLDPFAEDAGGRVDLVDAVLAHIRRSYFKDLLVVQGPAGSGKSAFSLRLANRLIDDGLHPVLVRFRDLRLSTYATVDELLQDAVRVGPLGEHPPPPVEPLFTRKRLAETVETGWGMHSAEICRTVLILDGWDEVALTGSVRFKQQIDELLPRVRERFVGGPGAPMRVVLTGRPSAAVDRCGVLRRETPILTLRPLRPMQVRRFAQQLADRLDDADEADWHLDLDRCEQAFTRYETAFSSARTNGTEVLGLPLLALLAFRTIAEWTGNLDELFAQPTALYSALVDLTTEHAGKAEPTLEGTVHRGGRTLRRLLQRVASIITANGGESVSFGELERRLEDDDALLEWTQQATDDNTLHELVVNFYFKGNAELGCEFLHKSFREYLFAEAIVALLEAATTGRPGPQGLPAREWGADFVDGSIQHEVSRSLASLLGPRWLTPEVRSHLFWLVERAVRGPQRERWLGIRDLLADIWEWWAEGTHLRLHPERRKGRDERRPPAVLETLHEASPLDGRGWTHSPSTATIDAHLGDVLLHLTAFVHEHLPDRPVRSDRRCQVVVNLREVRFRPFGGVDAQSLLGRLAAAEGRPNGYGLSRARLRAVDLSRVDLTGWLANEADLSDAQLDHAVLHQSRLRGADLRRASLVRALLTEAELVAAYLGSANLDGADLTDANLVDADLTGTDLTGAVLDGADLTNVRGRAAEPGDGQGLLGLTTWRGTGLGSR